MKPTQPSITAGALVKYSKPQCNMEKAFRFTVIDVDEAMVSIQLVCDLVYQAD